MKTTYLDAVLSAEERVAGVVFDADVVADLHTDVSERENANRPSDVGLLNWTNKITRRGFNFKIYLDSVGLLSRTLAA